MSNSNTSQSAMLAQAAAVVARRIPPRLIPTAGPRLGNVVVLRYPGLVSVFESFNSPWPLVQSKLERPLKADNSASASDFGARFRGGAQQMYLEWAMSCITARGVEPFEHAWFTDENQRNAPRVITWLYEEASLLVHDAFTGELLCQSLPCRPSDLGKSAPAPARAERRAGRTEKSA